MMSWFIRFFERWAETRFRRQYMAAEDYKMWKRARR
jgi:hypothetical protein